MGRCRGWTWSLQVSFMEVYNEGLFDLLRGSSGAATSSSEHVIIQHDARGTMVTGMTSVEVTSLEQVSALMTRAERQRSVGATDMNVVSSRSHSVFAMYLRGTNEVLGIELSGALHMVDLAGSERLSQSGSTGDRLTETRSINKSLASLSHVFTAKAEGCSHVPFRNSKLTHLMEPCLSGHGKTMMVVNVGPEASNSHETLCSLRFAGQVSQCDTGGKPKKQSRNLNRNGSDPDVRSQTPRGGAGGNGNPASRPGSRPGSSGPQQARQNTQASSSSNSRPLPW